MNELTVQVQQTPGEIKWNFEDLKNELAEQMEVYKSIVYTDENIGDAKKDLAALRKMDKSVDERRIEIKNKCLEPYKLIEEQAKELKELIAEPIKLISEKTDDYEKRRKAAKKEKIMQYMENMFSVLPKDIQKKLMIKIYETRWENAGTAEKVYKEAIKEAQEQTLHELVLLEAVDEDFRDQVMEVYKIDLNLANAMMKEKELQRQKELLIERERQRQEQERLRREEELRMKAEKEAEEEARQAEAQTVMQEVSKPETEENKAEPVKTEPRAAMEAQKPASEEQPQEEVQEKIYTCMLAMKGTAGLIQKAINYARYIGVECEVMRR